MTFYFEVLKQYYVGAMMLGPGNGVSDGSIIAYSLYIYAGIWGVDFFLKEVNLNFIGL